MIIYQTSDKLIYGFHNNTVHKTNFIELERCIFPKYLYQLIGKDAFKGKDKDSMKYCLFSYEFKKLTEPIYDDILSIGTNYFFLFKKNSLNGLIDNLGKELTSKNIEICNFDELVLDKETGQFRWEDSIYITELGTSLYRPKLICVMKNGLKGIINKFGKWVIKPKYEKIELLKFNFIVDPLRKVQMNGETFTIDSKEQRVD
jgi:hypothetical protein